MIELGVVVLHLIPNGNRFVSYNTCGRIGHLFVIQTGFAFVHLRYKVLAGRPLVFISECFEGLHFDGGEVFQVGRILITISICHSLD